MPERDDLDSNNERKAAESRFKIHQNQTSTTNNDHTRIAAPLGADQSPFDKRILGFARFYLFRVSKG